MIKKEPRMEYKDVFAAFFVIIGYLLFLVIVHLMRLSTSGYIHDNLNTIFLIMLRTLYGILILGISFLIIHFLKWLVWTTTTPKWLKDQQRSQSKYGRQKQ